MLTKNYENQNTKKYISKIQNIYKAHTRMVSPAYNILNLHSVEHNTIVLLAFTV